MPTNKDLKRLVRTRMQKTGESYSSARANLIQQKLQLPKNYVQLAGMSDKAVREKTGKPWREWVRVLDAMNAVTMRHREIADHIYERYDVSGWWAQMLTVGYERIRGLRDVGQRRGGKYDASKSKTIAVPVSKLYRAWSNQRTRKRWLVETGYEVRTSTPDKSMRLKWQDGTAVDVYFTAKGESKSQVALQHRNLPTKNDATRMKQYWADRLVALAELLTAK